MERGTATIGEELGRSIWPPLAWTSSDALGLQRCLAVSPLPPASVAYKQSSCLLRRASLRTLMREVSAWTCPPKRAGSPRPGLAHEPTWFTAVWPLRVQQLLGATGERFAERLWTSVVLHPPRGESAEVT